MDKVSAGDLEMCYWQLMAVKGESVFFRAMASEKLFISSRWRYIHAHMVSPKETRWV